MVKCLIADELMEQVREPTVVNDEGRKNSESSPPTMRHHSRSPARFGYVPGLCALIFLWLTLVNNLRVEWTINPQYSYGWAVPVLCLYLLARRETEERRRKKEEDGREISLSNTESAHDSPFS